MRRKATRDSETCTGLETVPDGNFMEPHRPQHGELVERRGYNVWRFSRFYGSTYRIIVGYDNQTCVQRLIFDGREFVPASRSWDPFEEDVYITPGGVRVSLLEYRHWQFVEVHHVQSYRYFAGNRVEEEKAPEGYVWRIYDLSPRLRKILTSMFTVTAFVVGLLAVCWLHALWMVGVAWVLMWFFHCENQARKSR